MQNSAFTGPVYECRRTPAEESGKDKIARTVTKMYGWILKTEWDIGRVMKWYSRRRGKTSWREI